MASTIVAESAEAVEDKDDSLIIIVNPDGTITVDPETLQKLISTNQHAGNVSVVRVDGEDSVSVESQGGNDASQVNLTVEGYYSQTPQESSILPEIQSEVDDSNKNDDVLDPFSQLDPEHLARLESALQSEQAKEILGHKLGDNLNEMLDILEQNDEKSALGEPQIEEPVVHNDHSYTSVAPFQGQSPAVTTRPLMRGGRTRMRGATGRIMTRGGLTRTAGSIGSQATTLASGKNIPKNIIITQGGRMLQPTLTADGKIQKKVITNISPNILSPSKIATIAGQPGNKVILKTTDGQKKAVIPVRVQKPKKVVQSPSKIDLETEKLKKQLEDELGEAHSPIPKFDPTIPQVVTIFKEKPNVVVKKFSPKSDDAAKNVKKTAKQEIKPVKIDTPTPGVVAPATPKSKQAEDDAKKKKEKGKATPTTPLILGPELFSTPDIIRRVSTDKTNAVEAVQEPSTPVDAQPEVPSEPKAETLDSIITSNCDIISAESLLDSIHAEVAKDPRFLDQGLLDELTNDDDEIEAIEMIGDDIEDTLEKMEVSEKKIAQNSTPVTPQSNQTTPNVRKLPPIELPTTRSATKKAAAAKDPSEESSQEAKRASVDSRKSSGDSRKQSVQEDDDDDDDDYMESDDDSVNSEDDPNRLWCICQKPHNNRFMICCDSCEDWFHGKCVGITKALGQQMEADGVEWTCPNCRDAKRKAAATKAKADALPPVKLAQKQPVKNPSQQIISSLKCITCKKPAKVESNYCGEICIKKHCSMMIEVLRRDTLGLDGKTPIVVFEKQSGRLLSGERAPTLLNLTEWMEKNKTFEVINPNMLPLNKYYKMNPSRPTVQTNKPQQLHKKPSQLVQSKPLVQQKLTLNLNKQVSIDKPQSATKMTSPKLMSPTGNKMTSPTNKVSSPVIKTLAPKAPLVQKTIVQKSIQPAKTVHTVQKAVIAPKTPQPAQKPMPKPQQKTISVQKTIQLIPTMVQTPSKAKVEEEKKKKPVTPVAEKKKEEKVEASPVKKDRKSKEEPKTTPMKEEPKKQPEPIRANVKRTLQELLLQRAQQDPELKPTTDEIKELVASIEEELFNLFKDVGAKYKSKYRSLVFNIKDAKNLTLYKKIIEKSVSPSQLVRLSPEELASQELAQWREKEAKHQIEIIKKNELDLIHLSKTVVLKSRKGEEIIESKNHEANISELESALNRTAEDDDVEAAKKETKKDDIQSILSSINKRKKEEEKRRDRKDRKRRRSRSRRSKSRERRRKSESDSRKSRSDKDKRRPSKDRSRSKDRSGSKDSEESKKGTESKDSPESLKDSAMKVEEKIELVDVKVKEEPEREEEFERSMTPPPPEKKLKEDDSDREPSSTTINTPPYAEEKPPFWTGILNMSEVTKLYTSAYEVSGSCDDLEIELSSNLECVGRIQPDSVWDYVSRMKKAGTKEIIVIRFQSDTEEEKMNYLSLYSYLNSRNRMAVVGAVSKRVKDFYVLPLASHSPIPQVLLPLDGPGFEDYRPHLLLGIIIRGGMALSSFPTHHKKKHSKVGRSYTPPLPDGSTTPPLLSNSSVKRLPLRGLTPPLPDLDDEPYSPGENDPYSPGDAEESLLLKQNPDIQKNLEEVNRMIEEKRQKIESMTSAASLPAIPGINEDDENEAYSPSERFTPPPPGSSSAPSDPIPFFDSKLTDIKLPSNLQEILASIKGTDATQPKGLDVSSDPIVKAYSSGYLDEDEDEEDEKSPVIENKSRDPRQRPEEKPPKSALSLLSDAELIRKAAEMEEARQPEAQRFYPMVPALPYPQQMPFPPAPALPISLPGPIMPPIPGTVIMPPIIPNHPPPLPDFPVKDHAFPPHKDFRRNKKWDQRRQGPNQGNFGNRRGFDRGGRFRNRFQGQRQGRGNSNNPNFRNRPRYDGVQSEWDEEIRNFEQRRRKRRNSRSRSHSSSPRRRRQKRDSESS